MTRLSALLATGRVANLPSVWSHVLTGVVLANLGAWPNAAGFPGQLAAVLILASLFYVGGCFLGDARDEAFDRANRPGRPIPTGILSARSVSRGAWALLILAWLLSPLVLPATLYHTLGIEASGLRAALTGGSLLRLPLAHQVLTSTLLFLAIVAYAILHKRSPMLGLVLMGSCRALLVIWAASMASHDERSAAFALDLFFLNPAVLAAAATTAAFTLGFVLVARTESNPDAPVPTLLVHAILVILPLAGFWAAWRHLPPLLAWPFAAAIAAYLAWLLVAFKALPRSKPTFVERCLAGFCLLDAVFLALSGPLPAALALAAFALALLLQRITPAT
jgi:4-hydroxybenzoate polyprenyltransferase